MSLREDSKESVADIPQLEECFPNPLKIVSIRGYKVDFFFFLLNAKYHKLVLMLVFLLHLGLNHDL